MKEGKHTFGELVADFETWASQTGWSNQDLFDHLKQTLNTNYINQLLYLLVVAKDYATLKAYGHSIDLQLIDLHNNQRQASTAGNNSSSAPCSTSGFRNLNAMDINANNINSHFQGLSNEDIIKKWYKWIKNCCCCCGSKSHENSLKKHPGPLVCNYCSTLVTSLGYALPAFKESRLHNLPLPLVLSPPCRLFLPLPLSPPLPLSQTMRLKCCTQGFHCNPYKTSAKTC
jgi:hypothetical protein